MRPEDVQETYRELALGKIDAWVGAKRGGCRIIVPGGDVIAQAAVDEETILTASVSLEAVLKAKADIDVGGHYSRPDVLQLLINRRPLARLVESGSVNPTVAVADNYAARRDSADDQTQEAENTG